MTHTATLNTAKYNTNKRENPHNQPHGSVKDTKECRLGKGKFWMVQAEDSMLLADRAQANQGVGKVPKPIPTSLFERFLQTTTTTKTRESAVENGQHAKRSPRSSFWLKPTTAANFKIS